MKSVILTFAIFLFSSVSILFAQIPNAGFENWTDGEPDDWHSTNVSGFPTNVSQSSDSHSGSSAVLIEVADFMGNPWTGAIISGSAVAPYFEISTDYAELTGYYKLSLIGGQEHGAVTVEFFDDPLLGGLVALGVAELVPADVYTQFTVTMDYTIGNGNPAAYTRINCTFGVEQGTPQIGSWFLVDDLSFSGVNSIEELKSNMIPAQFELDQNYPNPFNPSTSINFSVPKESFISLKIFNIKGEEVATLVNENLSAGNFKTDWNASNLPSGVYVYTLRAGDVLLSKKMQLLK